MLTYADARCRCIEIGALTAEDSKAITERLLQRNTKRFNGTQMQSFLANTGAKNPLWLSIAMLRLMQVPHLLALPVQKYKH